MPCIVYPLLIEAARIENRSVKSRIVGRSCETKRTVHPIIDSRELPLRPLLNENAASGIKAGKRSFIGHTGIKSE